MKKLIFLFSSILIFMSCSEKNNENSGQQSDEKIIGKPELKLKSDIMTPEVLWSFGRLSDVQVSPDEKSLLFGITYYDIPEDKGNRELYTMPAEGGDMKQITKAAKGEYNAVWSKDGKSIYFTTSAKNGMQIFKMNADGTGRKQISNIEGGISGFKLSPDQTKILYTKEVDLVKKVVDVYPDLPKANARIITDMMYRHWDTWTDSYSHIFIAGFNGSAVSDGTDIMKGEDYDSPLKPFGGPEEITWSPDGKTVAYTCVKKKGLAYTLSTNSDIYFYNLNTKQTVNFTKGMNGYDKAPVYSPDGSKIAWTGMNRDGYESDKNRLFVYDFNTKEKKDYTKSFDQNAGNLAWDAKGENIYFISDYHARFQIYKLNLASDEIKVVTQGDHNYRSVAVLSDKLIATKQSMSMPTEIFALTDEGKETQISFVNKDILNQLEMGKVEARWVKTTDNKNMLVWVIYPPHFDATKKYPALLYCQGGPQSSVSQFWSYRWNFQMMAADGYIIVAPNRRGLPSFGQAWNEQISGDYGGQNMKDYFSAIDALKKEPFIDENKLGAIGASYGGFSVYWLAGHHNKRFKAFIAHDGIFNLEAQYTETDELWFANWDLGGAPWDYKNKTAQRSYANSPHKFVDKWDTPIMVIHGGRDYRILDSQGFSAFDAAQLRGVPSKMLYFPKESHWVLKPQDGILWQREFKSWLDKWLK
ncbi:MAG: S9 family peptidase [Chlorobi bacterium]|nr:S9 family peptidase [Chlorobiota bacterium]